MNDVQHSIFAELYPVHFWNQINLKNIKSNNYQFYLLESISFIRTRKHIKFKTGQENSWIYPPQFSPGFPLECAGSRPAQFLSVPSSSVESRGVQPPGVPYWMTEESQTHFHDGHRSKPVSQIQMAAKLYFLFGLSSEVVVSLLQ